MNLAARKMDTDGVGSDADELRPGSRLLLGQFSIESFLNAGGFGIVYLARDSLDRQVVIKECFPSSYCRRIGTVVGPRSRAQQEEFRSVVRLFMQEAITLSQLSHPNIVKVHQVFEDNETAYMAMDYIVGPDLLETIEGGAAPLQPKEIIAILNEMLEAVGYVHSQGLLHRDISPDNILLDKATGRPVLIDFGASRKEVTRKSRALSGLRVVKDGYSPQEFYVSGSKQAPCSDLYALAASFYHLISGESPKTSQERLSAIAGREGDPLRPLAGRFKVYPPEFLRAIDKAMSVFPRDRLQSVEEWRAMLGPELARTITPKPEVAALRPAPQPVKPVPHATVAEAPVSAPPPMATAPRPEVKTAGAQANPGTAPVNAPVAAPVTAPLTAGRGARDLLMASTGAVLLLAVLLALPKLAMWQDEPATAPVAAAAAVTTSSAIASQGKAEVLPMTNVLRLSDGLTFEAIETATGTRTVVAAVPDGAATDLKVGDVLLLYVASGETLGTATALNEILKREFANGVTTYSFVIRRGASTMDAELRLGVSG
jgi:serine/threonine protein kinase